MKQRKYIFVIGGVLSSLGKGITAASLGRLLKDRGYKIMNQKLEPYLNFDAGTLNPTEHGEVFVLDCGKEADLDTGAYERFTDEPLTENCIVTTGQIYSSVINKERKGEYLGKTIQVIPHITNEIKSKIYKAAEESDCDILICELGGTIGDIEQTPFIEAIRQIRYEVGKENTCFINVSLIPYMSTSGELKTKPTQNCVKQLQGMGIQPDIIVCRTEKEIDEHIKNKIGMFCNVDSNRVIQNLNADDLYVIPLMLSNEKLDVEVLKVLNLPINELKNSEWIDITNKIKNLSETVEIALIGKYVELHDAYLSVYESLKHAGVYNDVKVKVKWIDSEDENIIDLIKDVDGIIVPGGFSFRGTEGMIEAIRYARENNIPCFGICLGMQMMSIEFARNVLGIKNASSQEFNIKNSENIICLMENQKTILNLGGTMRLGAYDCKIVNDKLKNIYKTDLISERHRHRYEFNNKYIDKFNSNGFSIAGLNPVSNLVEIVSLDSNKFHIGTQFHPEFKSRPNKPHPVFYEFVKASKENKKF